MNAEFFALAFSTVLNPKVLGIDLLLIANSRPRMMFLCFPLGGIGMSVTVGLLDVLVPPVKARGAGGFMPFRRCAALPPGVASAPGSPQTAMCKLEEGCNEHGRAEALRG